LSVRSQNQSKVRRSRVSRKAVCLDVSADGGVGPLIPVTDVAVVHADATTRRTIGNRRNISRMSGMGFLALFAQEVRCKNRRWLQSSATSADFIMRPFDGQPSARRAGLEV
jgi:hypothetical protein